MASLGITKIFRVELCIQKKKLVLSLCVKSARIGKSMYKRYKNVNLNKIQRSNELVHITGQRVS